MNHLEYYSYQTQARGITGTDGIKDIARQRHHVYKQILFPALPKDRSQRVVELACGHGSLLWLLGQEGYTNILGIDSSDEQITAAKLVCDNVEKEDVTAWLSKSSSDSVDAIVAIDLIEHISKDDFMELLKESKRVLVPGGRLIMRCPNGDSPFVGRNLFNDITHIWCYTTNCMRTLSKMHGYSSAVFSDECDAQLTGARWWKIPVSKLARGFLKSFVKTASREN